jgi:hypothetical protein
MYAAGYYIIITIGKKQDEGIKGDIYGKTVSDQDAAGGRHFGVAIGK